MKRNLGIFGLVFVAALFWALFFARPACAQIIIRDAEIEDYMTEWFTPVFQAAGMDPEQVKIILVQDGKVNAFVAGGANIFFFTGLLEKTESPGEVIGVMAHELGHISGGHLIRARKEMENASYESILGTIIGIGAAIASGNSAAAPTIGTASASMAERRYLSTARTYESSADQFALTTLETAKLNPSGFLSFMEKLSGEELLPSSRQSEYVRSHPLTHDRISSIEAGIRRSTYVKTPLPLAWAEQHARMKAKLLGFINPAQVVWVYDDRDKSVAATSARAIAAYRQNHVQEALNLADILVQKEPDNPYFQELKGQMLLDFGRVKEALPYYEKAVSLKPKSGLIRTALAHAQIETAGQDTARLEKAVSHLKIALESEPRSGKFTGFWRPPMAGWAMTRRPVCIWRKKRSCSGRCPMQKTRRKSR